MILCEDEWHGKKNIMGLIEAWGHGTIEDRGASVLP